MISDVQLVRVPHRGATANVIAIGMALDLVSRVGTGGYTPHRRYNRIPTFGGFTRNRWISGSQAGAGEQQEKSEPGDPFHESLDSRARRKFR